MIWGTLTDTFLALAANRQDAEAWEQLYRKLYPYLFSIYYRAFRGDRAEAEEAAHESIIRVFRNFNFSNPEPAKVIPSYLARVVETLISDQRRRSARAAEVPLAEIDVADEKANFFELRDFLEQKEVLLKKLSGDERELAELLSRGFRAAEIGDRLGISAEAVYQRISRLRKRLREA